MKFYKSDINRLQKLIDQEIKKLEKVLKDSTDEKEIESAENELIELDDLRHRIRYIV